MSQENANQPARRPELRTDGIYSLPRVGQPAAKARRFFDEVGPQPDDRTGVRIAKQAAQAGVIITTVGVVGTIVL